MGLFDFLKPKKEKKFSIQKEEKKTVAPKVKKDLGVCIPIHARSTEERKKIRKEESPFEKLRREHEKDLGRTLEDIEAQEPEEPYDYEPELGVEGIEEKKVDEKKIEGESKEKEDELDLASRKMAAGYVPRFSSTARQKLGLEEKHEHNQPIQAEFEVSGVYVGVEAMISGRVVRGTITKRMVTQIGNSTARISDLKKSFQSVNELNSGETGTIFMRGNGVARLKAGDILEFS